MFLLNYLYQTQFHSIQVLELRICRQIFVTKTFGFKLSKLWPSNYFYLFQIITCLQFVSCFLTLKISCLFTFTYQIWNMSTCLKLFKYTFNRLIDSFWTFRPAIFSDIVQVFLHVMGSKNMQTKFVYSVCLLS